MSALGECEVRPRALLVNMPFGPLYTPSLALSTFKSLLATSGIESRVLYCNIDFANIIGEGLAALISAGLPRAHDLVGEIIFSPALYGRSSPSGSYQHYLNATFCDDRRRFFDAQTEELLDHLRSDLASLQAEATLFVRHKAAEICETGVEIVAFTSSFQQNIASLALAQSIKRARPEVFVIFGGANCDDEMGSELFQQFPFIDILVKGEADNLVPLLFHTLLSREDKRAELPRSVLYRDGLPFVYCSRPLPDFDLNKNPLPDFSDFIASSEFLRAKSDIRLLFETSRGCWWGEKHHCKFCGLNGGAMKFRKKEPRLALEQFQKLQSLYPDLAIGMTDNIIDVDYLRTVIPALASAGGRLDLFYEVKANLRKEHVKALSDAGVRSIQPGIESFSDDILRLMDKGITGLQNIQLLKWCREYGVSPEWNLLWGFPGETAFEYQRMAELLPLLYHLKPPNGAGRLRQDRFSPYFERSTQHFSNVVPFPAYSYAYRLDSEALKKIAYFFDGTPHDALDPKIYSEQILPSIQEWKRRADHAVLAFFDDATWAAVLDSRSGDGVRVTLLTRMEARIMRSADKIANRCVLRKETAASEASLFDDAFDRLLNAGVIIRQDDLYLSLAVPAGPKYPSKHLWMLLSQAVYSQSTESSLPSEVPPTSEQVFT